MSRHVHWTTRAFRALLALYPGVFGDEFGRELALVFTDRFRDDPASAVSSASRSRRSAECCAKRRRST